MPTSCPATLASLTRVHGAGQACSLKLYDATKALHICCRQRWVPHAMYCLEPGNTYHTEPAGTPGLIRFTQCL